MNNQIKEDIISRLKEMSENPTVQIKRLAIGTLLSLLAMLALVLTSDLELQWLFYILSIILVVGVVYAIPGYIGIWVWRMKDTLFKK
ncbi:MAG: hypothetical protein COA86_08575 [Kangiella sp.]|nr:MAG: hypothetical protein COA86_08575 [Kangiella sp.]